MKVHIPASRAVGIALIAASFAVGVVESGLFLRADDAIPLWDKAIHALCAAGVVLAVAPRARTRVAVGVGLGAGFGWEVIQFAVDPFQGHAPLVYWIDTLTDLAADVVGALIALRWTAAPVTRVGATAADPRPAERTT